MKDKSIQSIAKEAREIIKKIPFAKEEKIDFHTCYGGDPIVSYQLCEDGYYQIIQERGVTTNIKVANDKEEMISYFVHDAIWQYAQHYELLHRRKFESNLRQFDEVMEQCYHYIDPTKKLIREAYDDEIHIYLDLFDTYREIAQNYREMHYSMYLASADDIDYIADGKYADSPSGRMSNIKTSMMLVRERIERIEQSNVELGRLFKEYEKYYEMLKLQE